ncbi:MAG: histidinol-phosphate transaminase [Bacteroidales bacterium]|nr:histidinol-phosphate transaminase [Bacteroidales bacterium]
MKDIERLIRPNIAALCPYSTARDEYQGPLGIFLDANESPYPNGFNRYPDPHQKALKAKLSKIKGLPVENIFLGNGSDEAIDLVFRVFCRPGVDNAVAMAPSYGMYAVAAATNDIEVRSVQLGAEFDLPAEALLQACDDNTRVMFLCSPNNPTGNAYDSRELLSLADRFDGILVVDEAYADFSSKGSIRSEVLGRSNVIVLQTLSKAYGMAGLRLGMAFACKRIIELMSMVKYPYNINQAALDKVSELLDSPVEAQIREIIKERRALAEYMTGLPYVKKVYPSDANFLLVKVDDADALYDHLIGDGIIVRNRNRVAGCSGCLRITIGLGSENDKLRATLATYRA